MPGIDSNEERVEDRKEFVTHAAPPGTIQVSNEGGASLLTKQKLTIFSSHFLSTEQKILFLLLPNKFSSKSILKTVVV